MEYYGEEMLFELLGKKGLYAVFCTSKSDRLFRLIKSSIHRTERRVCVFLSVDDA